MSGDAGLRALAEIVHDLDLNDNKFNRSEAAGLGAVIRGLAESLKDDRKLALQCGPIFDGLYELLARASKTTGGGRDGDKQVRRKPGKQSKRPARR